MLRVMRTLIVAVLLGWGMTGCQALTGDTLGQNIDDTTITTTVKAKLAADKGSSVTRVQVDTNRGVVALTGTVESAADRARAEQITRTVGGVKGVANNLQVQK